MQVVQLLNNPNHPVDLIVMGNCLWHMEFRPEQDDTLQAYDFLFKNTFKPV